MQTASVLPLANELGLVVIYTKLNKKKLESKHGLVKGLAFNKNTYICTSLHNANTSNYAFSYHLETGKKTIL